MTVASAALTFARSLLNDPDPGSIFTDTKLIPILELSSKELQLKLRNINALDLKETAALLTVPANTLTLNGVAGYPSDLLQPVELLERESGSTDVFTPMDEREWEPDIIADESIKYWVFREQEIKVNPSTAIRQVKLRYIKSLPVISSAGSTLPVVDSETWLGYKTAITAAIAIGENPGRAAALVAGLTQAESNLLGSTVKGGQVSPARHKRRRRR